MRRFFVLNTNKKLDPSCYDEQTMLKEGIAAAYLRRDKIRDFKIGDIVFLYSNRVGIIACGLVSGPLQMRMYRSNNASKHKEAYFKKLDNFVEITGSPISTRDFVSIYGKVSYRRAIFELTNSLGAEKLYRECIKRSPSKLMSAA